MTFNRTTTVSPIQEIIQPASQPPADEPQPASPRNARRTARLFRPRSVSPARTAQPTPKTASQPMATIAVDNNPLNIDWVTWGLALLALVCVGGQIPLWIWVYLLYNPPLP
jgi:hypothetical protein